MSAEAEWQPHWTLDPATQPYLLWATRFASALLTIGILANIFSWNDVGLPVALRIIGSLVGTGGAVSALFLLLGMLSYWWQVYQIEHGTYSFWLILLVLGNWVGATIFYFLVFRRVARSSIQADSLSGL